MGTADVTGSRPSFYARTGTARGDAWALLHVPYTLWHLSYVVIGAALADDLDVLRLIGTLVAFALGLGIGAHALDELHDRPLSTGLSDTTLRWLGWGGLGGGAAMAVIAAFVVSPVALVWGAVGVVLAAGYAREWAEWIHTRVGFAIAWGAFPVLAAYWAQAEALSAGAGVVALAAWSTAMAQRALSSPARQVRRRAADASAQIGGDRWERNELLATWETPLKLLAAGHVLLAIGLLLAHV